jgi:transcription elongation factor GreB
MIPKMSKAFTRESESDEDDDVPEVAIPKGTKNYITPWGYRRLKGELKQLVEVERPEVTRTVSWAASNGDRSENGDYIYGKRRLREIDRRIRYLMKRLDIAEVVDPRDQPEPSRVFFGATVTYADSSGEARTVSIVGIDEVDPPRGRISWISPVARALLKASGGDSVVLRTPAGVEELEILDVRYIQLEQD